MVACEALSEAAIMMDIGKTNDVTANAITSSCDGAIMDRRRGQTMDCSMKRNMNQTKPICRRYDTKTYISSDLYTDRNGRYIRLYQIDPGFQIPMQDHKLHLCRSHERRQK